MWRCLFLVFVITFFVEVNAEEQNVCNSFFAFFESNHDSVEDYQWETEEDLKILLERAVKEDRRALGKARIEALNLLSRAVDSMEEITGKFKSRTAKENGELIRQKTVELQKETKNSRFPDELKALVNKEAEKVYYSKSTADLLERFTLFIGIFKNRLVCLERERKKYEQWDEISKELDNIILEVDKLFNAFPNVHQKIQKI